MPTPTLVLELTGSSNVGQWWDFPTFRLMCSERGSYSSDLFISDIPSRSVNGFFPYVDVLCWLQFLHRGFRCISSYCWWDVNCPADFLPTYGHLVLWMLDVARYCTIILYSLLKNITYVVLQNFGWSFHSWSPSPFTLSNNNQTDNWNKMQNILLQITFCRKFSFKHWMTKTLWICQVFLNKKSPFKNLNILPDSWFLFPGESIPNNKVHQWQNVSENIWLFVVNLLNQITRPRRFSKDSESYEVMIHLTDADRFTEQPKTEGL